MQYYSSFKYEAGIVYGAEEVVENYVTIAADPVSSLPDSFTLCSSLLVARAVIKHSRSFTMPCPSFTSNYRV